FRRQDKTDPLPEDMMLTFHHEGDKIELKLAIPSLFSHLQSQSRIFDGQLHSVGSATAIRGVRRHVIPEGANIRVLAQMDIGGNQVVIHMNLLHWNYPATIQAGFQ